MKTSGAVLLVQWCADYNRCVISLWHFCILEKEFSSFSHLPDRQPEPSHLLCTRAYTMPKPKVFVTRLIPPKGLELVVGACDAEIWPEQLPPPAAVLKEKVRGVEGLLCLLTEKVDDELLAAAGPQ
jgi:hypothetical protein